MAIITSSSVANPTVITATAHGFSTGDTVKIVGHTTSTPDINGNWRITVTGVNTFTIPVNVTSGGTGGSATLVTQVQVPISVRTISTKTLSDAYVGAYPAELAWVEDYDGGGNGSLVVFDGQTAGGTIVGGRPLEIGNTLFVAKNGTDTRAGLDPHDLRNPFLTVTAAQTAAASGDTIVVFPGDYTAETALAGKDGVFYWGLDGATLPAFNIATEITVKGRGLCQSITISSGSFSTIVDMPEMDTVGAVETVFGGVLTVRDVGTYLGNFGGTFTARNVGTYAQSSLSGVTTLESVGTFLLCDNGGTATAKSIGSVVQVTGGSATIRGADWSHDGTALNAIELSGSGSLYIYDSSVESTESGGAVIEIANSWSGTLFASGCDFSATTVGTDEATTGIRYGTGVTGDVQLKDCTIITAQNGTGVAKSIDAPSAQTVYVQGSLNQTHAVDSDITIAGGSAITNANFTA